MTTPLFITINPSSPHPFSHADWIELGKANQAELAALINKPTKFSDIFDVETYNKGCPPGFRSISKRDNGRGASCLRLKVGVFFLGGGVACVHAMVGLLIMVCR